MACQSNAAQFAACATLSIVAALLGANVACASPFSVRVLDAAGEPLANAVVVAYPLDGSAAAVASTLSEMSQQDQLFDPHLLVIGRGSAVSFPNLDQTRHHVYSFSEAKRFELKLYLGEPAEPVTFDVAGIVTIGCNIHDWMLAYIVVVDSPFFAKTPDDGSLSLELPAGRYRLWGWHPQLAEGQALMDETVQIVEGEPQRRELRIDQSIAPPPRPRRALGLPGSDTN